MDDEILKLWLTKDQTEATGKKVVVEEKKEDLLSFTESLEAEYSYSYGTGSRI